MYTNHVFVLMFVLHSIKLRRGIVVVLPLFFLVYLIKVVDYYSQNNAYILYTTYYNNVYNIECTEHRECYYNSLAYIMSLSHTSAYLSNLNTHYALFLNTIMYFFFKNHCREVQYMYIAYFGIIRNT